MLGIERWRQKTYGVPYWAEPYAIYYNKTLFKQKGVEDPWARSRSQGDWTLEEMVDAAAQDQRPRQRRLGAGLGPAGHHGIGPLIWTQGVSHLQYDPNVEIKLQLPGGGRGPHLGHRLDDAPAAQRHRPDARGDRRARPHPGRQAGDPRPGAPTSSPPARSGSTGARSTTGAGCGPSSAPRSSGTCSPCPASRASPALLVGRPPRLRLVQDEAPGRGLGLHEVDDAGRVPGLPGREPVPRPGQEEPPGAVLPPAGAVPLPAPRRSSPTSSSAPTGSSGPTTTPATTPPSGARRWPRSSRGEVALQGGLRELERLLNQDIDYGGGENPFKGVRWPIQPK